MVPAPTTEHGCATVHEWVHALLDYPPDICKNPDGTNKPDGSVIFFDDTPTDQILRSSWELRAIAVEMACRATLWVYYRCKGEKPVLGGHLWDQEFMLGNLSWYFWNNLKDLMNNIWLLMQ
jgi:hypothetical protein